MTIDRVKSFKAAFAGIRLLFQTQINARIHLTVTLLVVMAGFYFGLSRLEWLAIVLCIAIVLAMEAMNTAVEYLTDLVSPEYNPKAGAVKDLAAAAVLVTAFGAVAVGLIIFLPKIFPQ